MRHTVFAAAALLAIMALPVQAQDSTALFARLDQNADGQVTKDEIIAQRTALFARLDRNGDGVIDTTEQAQFQQSVDNLAATARVFSARQFRQLDTNRDGKVSLVEMQVTGRAFGFADSNGDGALTPDEFKAVVGLLANR